MNSWLSFRGDLVDSGTEDLVLWGRTVGLGLVQLGDGAALGAQNSFPHTDGRGWEGMEETHLGSSQRCMVRGREAAAQAERGKAQAGYKEKSFPWGQPSGVARAQGGWAVSVLECFTSQLGEVLIRPVWAHSWACSGQGLGPWPPWVPMSLNCPAISMTPPNWTKHSLRKTSKQTKPRRTLCSASFFSTNLNSDYFMWCLRIFYKNAWCTVLCRIGY